MRRWIWGLLGIASLALISLLWRATAPLESPPRSDQSSNANSVPGRIKLAKPSITPMAPLSDQEFSAEPVKFTEARPDGFAPAGLIYKFGPSGQVFPQPVTITVPYDPRLASKGAALALWTRSETDPKWSRVLGAVVDEERHVLVAQVQHFSLFAPGQDCTDLDGDGYSPCTGDCDESNPAINPGADEICGDRIDQNCNLIIDEGCPSEW